MDDFGILAQDFGFKPQGKSAPMKSTMSNDIDYDSIFKNSNNNNTNEVKSKSGFSSLPVYDKPVYDDDIFEGLPGMKSKPMYSGSGRFDDNVFSSVGGTPSDDFDDLLGNLGRTEKVEHKAVRGFDDLLPGFGSGGLASGSRFNSESVPASTDNNTKATSNAMNDPFVVLESTSTPVTSSRDDFVDPLENIHKISKSDNTNAAGSVSSNMFDDIDPLHGFGKPAPALPTDSKQESGFKYSENESQKVPVEDFQESQKPVFDMPPFSSFSQRRVDRATSPPAYTKTNSQADMSPSSEENVHTVDDIWLTVSEIPLFTQPTRAPPPSRPPPPKPRHASKSVRTSFASNTTTFGNNYSDSPKYSSFNPFQHEFENFSMGNGEETDSNSASAAMKDAMDRAEAKFRQAKELREREHAKASRNKESMNLNNGSLSTEEAREREEQEREKTRLEKERMREIERVKARQAVERATREARERAAAEARLKVERAAVQRAQAEARERAAMDAKGRAERAAAEARELASVEASEKAAAEAREKAAREKAAVARAEAEARRRAERAAVERVAAEARQRAAAEARDRAAAAAKVNQQKNDNDLESFFSSRPSSVPRPRATSSDPAPDPLFQNRRGQEGPQRTSSTGVSSNMRKASSTTNIVDDLSSIFGAAPSSAGEFQDVEGETEERRRARLERQQRTQERAAKALAEKNQRDLQSQREQEERNRISETLDIEIKRWAAGKEGNLRALLSTLQYVLWPGCGWQPVSLTDLITGANVKKSYRKATLCIHPDKVQQKGANLQQKYVAEKVFDLLKEAWNKFNSEELF
ncbi:auxilin-related protein 1-like isoform X2 [Bidens hawaiensis]|uniref:auxilin-related protein 1-like isoform X2 n=1 Tax=Bidens hawaiensis TaxID=980011 RepID=UPI00404A929A